MYIVKTITQYMVIKHYVFSRHLLIFWTRPSWLHWCLSGVSSGLIREFRWISGLSWPNL